MFVHFRGLFMYVQFTTEVYKAMPKPPEAEPLLTVEDAARLTQTSTKWIRNQIRLGKLRIMPPRIASWVMDTRVG